MRDFGFGNRLYQFRKKAGLSQSQLGQKVGLSNKAVSKWKNGLYYEIDIYPEWKDKAVMEIELYSEDQEIVFPEGIDVIREVTGNPAYSNHELARMKPKEE